MRKVLVLGGSGYVGAQILYQLHSIGFPAENVWFTYCKNTDLGSSLENQYGFKKIQLDLSDNASLRLFLNATKESDFNTLISCCGIYSPENPQSNSVNNQKILNTNARIPIRIMQSLRCFSNGPADAVFVGALDHGQAFQLNADFVASQGYLAAAVNACAKKLGPNNVRVNMVALGLLQKGLSKQIPPKLVEDFQHFSALQRLGTAEEVAPAIVWLALNNSYMNGKVLPINGGI